MRKLFASIILSFFSLSIIGQTVPIDEDTKLITYKDIVQQKGTPQILYARAEAWVKARYKNPFDVLGQRSAEEGYLNGKANIRMQYTDKKGVKTPAGLVTYTFRIEFKEDRYRYVFTDFILQASSRFPLERWINEEAYQTAVFKSYLQQVDQHILETIESLENAMTEPEKKKDDW